MSDAARLHFEDFALGEPKRFGERVMTAQEMIAFARQYDPQPFHIDEQMARATPLKGLIASGWHTCGVMMRMLCDEFINRSASLGAPGVEELRWIKPVRPGDALTLEATVHAKRASRKRPELGLLQFFIETQNQRGETVMTSQHWAMMRRHDPTAPTDLEGAPKTAPPGCAVPDRIEPGAPGFTFEGVRLGERHALGSQILSADDIIGFAREFDPQPFHLDEAAGRASLFGGLAASGWHLTAMWMRRVVEMRLRHIMAAPDPGAALAALGPSPGFVDLKWLRPALKGDEISFFTTPAERVDLASKPDWGLLRFFNEAINQRGETVMTFTGQALLRREG